MRAKPPAPGYDAFISYSHAIKGELASALQHWLERFATPWYKPRSLRIFRDFTSMSANEDLGRTIEEALASSSWLILLASPEAARSSWVNREVAWWRQHRSADRVCVVLTDGQLRWSDEHGDWDRGATTALPPAAAGMFRREPLWVDLSSVSTHRDLDRSNPVLLNSVAQIAAPLRGVDKDLLVGEHITLHRRARRQRRGGIAGLAVLTVAALVAAGLAVVLAGSASRQRRTAELQRDIATARQLTAQADAVRAADPQTALMLAMAAQDIHPAAENQASLVTTLTAGRLMNVSSDHVGPIVMALSSDGRTMATADADDTLSFWDVSEFDRPHRLGEATPVDGGVRRLAFVPNAPWLITSDSNERLVVWDIADVARPRRVGQPVPPVGDMSSRIAVAPDGKTLAVGYSNALQLLDLSDPEQPRAIGDPVPGHSEDIFFLDALAYSPDGTLVVTGGEDNNVIIWNVTDRTRPRRVGAPLNHSNSVRSLAFAPDGRTLAAGTQDGTIAFWDLTNRTRPRQLREPLAANGGGIRSLAFSPDGRTLASGGEDNAALLWDVSSPAQPRRLGNPLTGHTGWIKEVGFSRDGTMVATAGLDGPVMTWSVADRFAPRPVTNQTPTVEGELNAVAFAPNGRTVVAAGAGFALWDVSTPDAPRRTAVTSPAESGADLTTTAFNQTGDLLATGSSDGAVALWDVADPTRPRRLTTISFDESVINAVRFAPNAPTLAVASHNGLTFFDVREPGSPRQLGPLLTDHEDAVLCVAFTPDGLAAVSGDFAGTVIIWDLTTRAAPHRLGQPLTGRYSRINAVALTPDGHTLIAAYDRNVTMWNVADRSQPRRTGTSLGGLTSAIVSLAVSPDGRTLATVGDSVVLWDLTDLARPRRIGQPLSSSSSQATALRDVAFSTDGRTLATGDDTGTLSMWGLGNLADLRDHPVETACRVAGRGLNREEWGRYISGVPYRPTCAS